MQLHTPVALDLEDFDFLPTDDLEEFAQRMWPPTAEAFEDALKNDQLDEAYRHLSGAVLQNLTMLGAVPTRRGSQQR